MNNTYSFGEHDDIVSKVNIELSYSQELESMAELGIL